MNRLKVDYGIDLGTTNSAICRMENGIPTIKKIETTDETMPSCVSFNRRGGTVVGSSAYRSMKSDKKTATKSWTLDKTNTYVEFKRTMGTDKMYHSDNMKEKGLKDSYTSEELSAEVLKALKSFVTDETFSSVVITVPAKFTVNQIDATKRAAKIAGFDRCELLQEPIAASMAYGLSSNEKNGCWLVFDFGGGTFDVALIKVEDGIMQVFDTEGDNYLGGKNLDYAIVDKIIIPYLQENYSIEGILNDKAKKEVLRDAMKTYAEDAKNKLSFKPIEDIISDLGDLGEDEDGEEIELDLSLTQAQVFDVFRPYFQKAVDICKGLLSRNGMTGNQLSKIILVGGPTHSPLIRQMLKEQISPNVDTSIDPMTAVATGAALYASTIDNDVKDSEIEEGTINLEISYESTTVDTSVWIPVKIKDVPDSPSSVNVEFVRSDKAWASGKVMINKIGDVIEANLIEGKANSFSVICYDDKGNKKSCFPEEITIIQGSKVGAAPLPYNIGIAIWNEQKKKSVIAALQGLEKNKPLPAIGVRNGLKTTKQLRPGVGSDIMSIPVYQADYGFEGKTASLFEYVADVIITGDDVESVVPEGSEVDVTLKVNSSQGMSLEVQFKAQGFDVAKELDTSKNQSVEEAAKLITTDLRSAQTTLDSMKANGLDVSELQSELDAVKADNENNSEKKAVLQHLKEVLRKIDDYDTQTEWQRLEKQLREEFDRLEKANNDLGNEKTTAIVNQFRSKVDQVIRSKDIQLGHDVIEEMGSLYVHLTMLYQCIGLIRAYDKQFSSVRWKDANRARSLINNGLAEINGNPRVEVLHPIACGIIELLPDNQRNDAGGKLRGI